MRRKVDARVVMVGEERLDKSEGAAQADSLHLSKSHACSGYTTRAVPP